MNSPKKMSLMVFDDIFFIYDHDLDTIMSKSILDLNEYLKNDFLIRKKVLFLFRELPYVIIPEMMFQDGENQLLINQKYPHLLPVYNTVKMDTWPLHLTKCIYYMPRELYNYRSNVHHLYTAFSKYSELFFNTSSNALWTFKVQDKIFAFLRVHNSLRIVKTFEASTPDETCFHLLKILEPYKEFQDEIILWTNYNDPYYLQIMSKYILRIKLENREDMFIIKDILVASCASLQEI